MATQLEGVLSDQIRPARDPETAKAYVKDTVGFDYSFDDTGDDLEITIPASPDEPVYLLGVWHLVRTAFESATDPTINVGDGSDADEYLADNTHIEPTTADNLAGPGIEGGKKTAPFTIAVTLGGTPTAGAGSVFVDLFRQKV